MESASVERESSSTLSEAVRDTVLKEHGHAQNEARQSTPGQNFNPHFLPSPLFINTDGLGYIDIGIIQG